MKIKLLISVIFMGSLLWSSNCFAQNVTQETSVKTGNTSAMGLVNEQKKAEGMLYLGNGEYSVTKVGGSGFVSLSKLENRCMEQIQEFTSRSDKKYKIITTQEFKTTAGVLPKVSVNFLLLNQDGTIAKNDSEKERDKEKAKKEIIELKELLDLNILTQEEYDAKVKELKKIILAD